MEGRSVRLLERLEITAACLAAQAEITGEDVYARAAARYRAHPAFEGSDRPAGNIGSRAVFVARSPGGGGCAQTG